jgi:hypothetical protein
MSQRKARNCSILGQESRSKIGLMLSLSIKIKYARSLIAFSTTFLRINHNATSTRIFELINGNSQR